MVGRIDQIPDSLFLFLQVIFKQIIVNRQYCLSLRLFPFIYFSLRLKIWREKKEGKREQSLLERERKNGFVWNNSQKRTKKERIRYNNITGYKKCHFMTYNFLSMKYNTQKITKV